MFNSDCVLATSDRPQSAEREVFFLKFKKKKRVPGKELKEKSIPLGLSEEVIFP